MTTRHTDDIRNFDINVVLQLDQKVSDQQQTLEAAGVPGFYVTNNEIDIQVSDAPLEIYSASGGDGEKCGKMRKMKNSRTSLLSLLFINN